MDPRTLWTNVSRTRFFLIPDGEPLPSGELPIRTITARETKVDDVSLFKFEVTEEEAKSWLRDEFGKMLDGARAAAERFTARLRGE